MLDGAVPLRRHDLVRLTAAGWERALAGVTGAHANLAGTWRVRALPLVVRRTEPGVAPGALCLGLPGPPDVGSGIKPRIGFVVAAADVADARAPLALDEAEVPAPWTAAFAALCDALRDVGIEARVFGSVAMQCLTGERYLHANSDIDLLLRPTSAAQLEAGLAVLVRFAHRLPLDGEIEFPCGRAVSWKEWAMQQAGADRVLAKHRDSVSLLRRDALLAPFREAGHG